MSLNYPIIGKILGIICIILGVAMLPSFFISLLLGEDNASTGFFAALIPLFVGGGYLIKLTKPASRTMHYREGFLVVAVCWITASLIGSIPYIISGIAPSVADAIFESTSGFTTTGATIFNDVESLPKSLLLWRSFSQWLGGMGILVFAIAILPALGISGQILVKAEAPGPTLEKVALKLTDSAKLLYSLYIGLTLLQIILLMLGDMSLFDACIFALGSSASGGLSNYNDGLSHFNSPYLEGVISVFTILSCVNFSLYCTLLQGKARQFFRNSELQTFLAILFGAFILIAGELWLRGIYSTPAEAIRYGFFQASSFITTTGHITTDILAWPTFSKFILFTLMFVGGCSNSTGGGIKVVRIMVLFKLIQRGIYKRLHPRAVVPIKMQGKNMSSDTVSGITAFTLLYFLIFLFGTLVLSLEPFDFLTAITASAAALCNIGTSFGVMSLPEQFAMFSEGSKLFLSLLMLIGRLELFTILLLFTPAFWDPDKSS